MKKIIALILCAVLCLSLCACGMTKNSDLFIEGVGLGTSRKTVEKKGVSFALALASEDAALAVYMYANDVFKDSYVGTFVGRSGQVTMRYEKDAVRSMDFIYRGENQAEFYNDAVAALQEVFGRSYGESDNGTASFYKDSVNVLVARTEYGVTIDVF